MGAASTVDVVSAIDARIAAAPMGDLPTLIDARGALMDQNERHLSAMHVRRERLYSFYAKVGFSALAGLGGGAFVAAGFGLAGFFLVGAAAAVFVPDYVKDFVSKSGPSNLNAQ
jgi:hypothetical protein